MSAEDDGGDNRGGKSTTLPAIELNLGGKPMEIGWIVIPGIAYLAAIFVCFQKGKTGFGWLGVVGLFPLLTPFLAWFPVVGAVRYAKPNSGWAQARYGPTQMARANRRFPEVGRAQPTTSPVQGSGPPPASTTDQAGPTLGETTRRLRIGAFLESAQEAGVIDMETVKKLKRFLDRDTPAPATPEPSQARPSSPPPEKLPAPGDGPTTTLPGDTARPVLPSLSPPPRLAPPPRRPVVPTEPGPFAIKASELWKAAASDVALHGFAYLGVLLTFVGVLGFLLFAFVDVPDATQPFVELFIALVFFGWAWVLRRQKADRVADGMELIGGMVLPLILFAGLVDNAPFPPDFQGGALVVALTLSAMALAAIYAWIAVRNPGSTLRFLVAPLLWLGAMTLGFVFKTDEVLTSDAITRLVSAQPAMASVAIAITLAVCVWKPDHRLTSPAVTSSLLGLPAAYLLTVSLSFGEGWVYPLPIVVLGVATMVSAELLGSWFERQKLVAALRPLLLAGVILPLIPIWDVGWAGLAVALAYLALMEWTLRSNVANQASISLTGLGITTGAVMSLARPTSALLVFSLLTVWSHLRRTRAGPLENLEIALTALAAGLPLGIGYGLLGVLDADVAWLVMAIVLATVTVVIRWQRPDDAFWAFWPTVTAWVIAFGAISVWSLDTQAASLSIGSVVVLAAVVGLGPRWSALRLWMGSALLSTALAMALQTWDLPADQRSLAWAYLGLALVLAALAWRLRPAGHLAAIGHIMAAGALVAYPGGALAAAVLGTWTAGWIASVVSGESRGASLTSLLERTAVRLGASDDGKGVAAAGWIAPLFLVTSIPPTVITTANLWDEFADHRSWTGVALAAIALLYGLTARLVRPRKPLSRTLAIGAIVVSTIGVAVAAPDSWPIIFAAASIIGVAALLTGDLRNTAFVWLAWIMSVVLVLLLAERAGVDFGDLHYVALAWGGVMLLGGLVLDDVRSGRRLPGQGLRERWLRYPTLLGALTVPLALGPTFASGTETAGWWSLGAAVLYFVTALLMRAGLVTAPAYGLAAFAVAALSPWSLLEQPWRFVVLAGPMVGVSWLLERRQTTETKAENWLRWDLPPLVVAHVVAVLALVFALSNDMLASTSLAFGALAIAIGLWRRARAWIKVGNVMILASAAGFGLGWLALALAGTSIRGMLGALLTKGTTRASYHWIGLVSAGLAWITTAVWQEWELVDLVSYTALAFGGLALVVSLLVRIWTLGSDSAGLWGGLAVLGVVTATFASINPAGPPRIDGPWLAVGLVLVAVAFELAAEKIGRTLRILSSASAGAAWLALAYGLGWDRPDIVAYSALVFGGLGFVIGLLARYFALQKPSAQRWGGLAVAGMLVTGLIASPGGGDPGVQGPGAAIGILLLAAGFELAAPLLGQRIRYLTIGSTGLAWLALIQGLGWDLETSVMVTTSVFGAGLIGTVETLRRRSLAPADDSDAVPPLQLWRAWAALGSAGVLIAGLAGLTLGDAATTRQWTAVGLAVLAVAAARGASPLMMSWLREMSGIATLASITVLAGAVEIAEAVLGTGAVAIAVLATFLSLATWRRAPESVWLRPLIVLGVAANLEGLVIGLRTLPELGLLVAVLLSIGVQAVAVGITLDRPGILAVGPPVIAAALIMVISESATGSTQWYTIPVGIGLLAEVEILRKVRRTSDRDLKSTDILVLEWSGMGLLAAPPLIEMFTSGIWLGLMAFGVAGLLLLWAVVTRVRRRAVAAGSLAIAAAILILFAAAAGGAPDSAFFWIVAVGVGFAVTLVAALVEAYRERKGHVMARVGEMMEGWE